MRHVWTLSLITCALAGGLVSCGGGGAAATSSSNTPALPAVRTTGFSLPSEVSPVSTGTSSAKTGASLFRSLVAPSPAVYSDAGTDYSNAQTVKYVSEHAIDQFAIIETILNAVSQTHYADAENINAGPYKSIVSWQQSNGSGQSKTVQTWIVDSSLVKVNGQDVNQVDAWIEDSGQVIRAKLMISASANQAADGSYLDYGVWTLNVKFDQAGTQYFAAEAYLDANGDSVVAINQLQQNGGSNTPQTSKAVMHKSATSGYGKVFYPDQNQNTPVQTRASYVYDAGQLLVHQTLPGPGSLTYQDRTQSVEITSQCGLYDSVTGADVMTTHSFGFPVSFTAGGATQYAYYGANQGQQQLWVNGGASVPDGTQVTRQDQGANGATYQTASFNGTLIKRTYVAAQLSDLLNIPVQTNINFNYQLTWSAQQNAWMLNGAPFTDFNSLVAAPMKMVWIGGWDSVHNQSLQLYYDPNGASGAGFYPGTMNNGSMMPTPNGAKYVPADQASLWINVGGSIYIEYTGPVTGWVQKAVTSFNQNTWTPTFDPNGDQAFTLGLNVQYFINNQGGNFIVTRTGTTPDACSVQTEIQTAANPVNVATLLGGAATFRPQGYDPSQPGQLSSYQLVTDPSAGNYLMLVYKSVGTQDANLSPVPNVGDTVSQGQWGLEAYDGQGADLGVQYDWNFPNANMGGMGVQTFLYTGSGLNRTYLLLDDPIQLAPLPLTVNGQQRTLSLQYNGWMNGLPDYSSDLAINNYTITPDIANKIINIPAGTVLADQQHQGTSYAIKPLQIGLYLPVAAVPDASLDITAADALNLGDPTVVPDYVENGLGAEPNVAAVKYVDGVKVP